MSEFGKCAWCHLPQKICRTPAGSHPAFCSTVLYTEPLRQAAAEYEKPDVKEFARQASIQEGQCYIDRHAEPHYRYPVKPRVQEIIEFCRKMGYQKLGLAFCGGLHREAAIFGKILENHGFTVVSVVCKVGGVDKSCIGVTDGEKVRPGAHESMCNPIAQAKILNAAGTDFNILLGLCVGHDSLFIKYSQAMVTVFAVKDRVLGHNPLAAIYNFESYYERFQQDRLKELTVKAPEK